MLPPTFLYRCLVLLPWLSSCPLAAAENSPTATPGAALPGTSLLEVGLALALIIALLLGTAWLARKVSGGKGFGQGGLKILGGVALGPRERIVLVEAGDTWLVVGIVPGQIRTLHTLPKSSLSIDPSATNEAPFAQWLKQFGDRHGASA